MIQAQDDVFDDLDELYETAEGDAVERHGIEPSGKVSISPTAHKMSAKPDFDQEVYANQDDPIDLGLQIQSGHSGFHGLQYDIGAERQVCSNGMTAFLSVKRFEPEYKVERYVVRNPL